MNTKLYRIILSTIFFVVLFIFWAFKYNFLLAYQEQYQLFLTTYQYLIEHLSYPGGLSDYIGEFLTQFYNNYYLGAIIISIELLIIQLLSWYILKEISNNDVSNIDYVLSFLPAFLSWLYLGDIDVMAAYLIALIFALLFGILFIRIRNKLLKFSLSLFLIPTFYWSFGPTVVLLSFLISFNIILKSSPHKIKRDIALAISLMVYTLIIVHFSSTICEFSYWKVWNGITYYRLPIPSPFMQWLIQISVIVIISFNAISNKFLKIKIKNSIIFNTVCYIFLYSISIVFMPKIYNETSNELLEYAHFVRINDWYSILKKAKEKSPTLPMSISATNLALAMTGQLDSRAFEFKQNGTEGLIPHFEKESNTSLQTAEIFYQLSLINTAQRYYFEAMEAIPNLKKSSRCIKRLAETSLINGDYEICRKYLNILNNTIFYKKWAQRILRLLDDPDKINNHPLYGRLRRQLIDADYFFSAKEIDKILGQLFLKDSTNTLALQYLIMFPLLQRDLDKFMQYVQVIQQRMPYKSDIMQQGVAFAMMKAGMEIPNGLIDPAIMNRFRGFAQAASQHDDLTPYRNTLWYYLTNNE